MSASERLPKQSPVRLKPAQLSASNNEPAPQSAASQIDDPQQLTTGFITNFSPAMLIHLQRTVGNRVVQHMLNQHRPGAIGMPPDTHIDHSQPVQSGETIQRAIKPMAGESSGWFRKGRRDKINVMVNSYNVREKQASSKGSSEAHKALLADIQKIWQAARAWQMDVVKSNPEKAKTIGDWIKTQVEREEDAKVALIGELHDAETIKAAWDGAAYNELYTTEAFTTDSSAGEHWLQTPALAPIYKYFITNVQHDSVTLDAYEDVTRYRQNPGRDEALQIYKKYDMGTADQLNITGEGVGGTNAINEVRQQMVTLESDPSSNLPATFGAIEKSLINVINEIFTSFSSSEPYKKVTTPPATG